MKSQFLSSPITLCAVTLTSLLFVSCDTPSLTIENPYESIRWDKIQQHKANLHTHTVLSDGNLNPHTAVDHYHRMGYSVLSLTDHNHVSYPWETFFELKPSETTLKRFAETPERYSEPFVFENRTPASLKMFAIQGNEVSAPHHVVSLFSDFEMQFETEKETLDSLAQKKGIAFFAHPGRYTQRNPEKYTLDWYVTQFTTYKNIIGMEIYNQGDRYPTDRRLWDSLLTVLLPNRQVWAISNDDMHSERSLGINWNVLLLENVTGETVREAIAKGHFFYTYAPSGQEDTAVPTIQNISVSSKKGTITITAQNVDTVIWVAGTDTLSRGKELTINMAEHNTTAPYVRAELWGVNGAVTGTQAFPLHR